MKRTVRPLKTLRSSTHAANDVLGAEQRRGEEDWLPRNRKSRLRRVLRPINRLYRKSRLRRVLRPITRLYRLPIARFHALPDFLIAGTPRSGTTSLFFYLGDHPKVVPPKRKELHFFSRHRFNRGINYYRLNFPPRSRLKGGRYITGEATPDYFCHPSAARRIKQMLPQIKIILLLRNPVDRAYSAYWLRTRRLKSEERSFENAIKDEEELLAKSGGRIFSDGDFYEENLGNFPYLSRGMYATMIKPWLEIFGKDRLLIIQSENFFSRTREEYLKVLAFLGLTASEPKTYSQFNAEKYPPMEPATRAHLVQFYEKENEKLYSLLGRNFDWS